MKIIDSNLKKAFLFFLLLFILLSLFSYYTKAHLIFHTINLFFFSLSSFSILFSVFLWIFSWTIILNKKQSSLFKIGFFSAFASLTPIQLGADLMRAHYSKKVLNIPITKSLSASILVKGMKFAMVSILATFLLFSFFLKLQDSFLRLFFLLGFLIVFLATLLFILPINPRIANFFSKKFKNLNFPLSKQLSQLFLDYPKHFHSISLSCLFLAIFFSLLSLLFEFLAFFFLFFSIQIPLSLLNILGLFIILSILERNPFVPKGIGLIETAGALFLALFEVPLAQIGVLIILYDFVRIFIPYSLSILVYLLYKSNKLSLK